MNEPFGDTEKEEFSEETAIRQMIDGITDCLASMTKEERLAWFRRSQYPHPLNFQKTARFIQSMPILTLPHLKA